MMRLDVGLSPRMWAAWLGCMVPLALLLNLPVLAVSWMFASSSELSVLGYLLGLPLLLADSLLVARLMHHYRDTFWLDGRTLVRRVITGRRRYDLLTAQVSVETARPQWGGWYGQVLPRLVVEVPGRARVRLWLRDPARQGALPPPDQLAALAKAIDPSLRHPVARRLWELAVDPLGGAL